MCNKNIKEGTFTSYIQIYDTIQGQYYLKKEKRNLINPIILHIMFVDRFKLDFSGFLYFSQCFLYYIFVSLYQHDFTLKRKYHIDTK